MICSMTGYGKGSAENGGITVTVEMKAVNQRFLDVTVKLPRNLLAYEDSIRKLIQKSLSRGKLDVFVTYTDLSGNDAEVVPDEGLVKAYIEAFQLAAEKYSLSNKINSTDLLRIPDAFTVRQKETDPEVIGKLVEDATLDALYGMLVMRQREGKATVDTFRTILSDIKNYFEVIKERAPLVPIEYKEKLNQRLTELLGFDMEKVDPQRLATEIGIFADKCCIDEEITRFSTHIDHFESIISESEEPIGKKLDFLIQEMNRETNTMGSKANDITITENVIAIKNEIEKLREQVQNLE